MHLFNPLRNASLPRFREASALRPLRDQDATGQLWKKVAQTTGQDRANAMAIAQLQSAISRLRRRIVGAGGGTSNVNVTGGALEMYRFKAIGSNGDYVIATSYNGSADGPNENVALPYLLRNTMPFGDRNIDGDSLHYFLDSTNGINANTQSRCVNVTNGTTNVTNTLIEVITPRYVANDVFFVMQSDHTNVSVSNVALTLIDVNLDGRSWALKNGQ